MKITPNFISSLRVFPISPIVCAALANNWLWLALPAMVAAEITDILDGTVARRTNQVSNFGKIFDPMCDSIYHMVVWIGLMNVGWVSQWFVILFFTRDALVSNIRICLAKNGTILAAKWSGKIKAVTQAVAQISIVVLNFLFPDKTFGNIQFVIVFVAALVTIFSLYDYGCGFWEKVKNREIVL